MKPPTGVNRCVLKGFDLSLSALIHFSLSLPAVALSTASLSFCREACPPNCGSYTDYTNPLSKVDQTVMDVSNSNSGQFIIFLWFTFK